MEKITVQIILTMEEVDRLLEKLDMFKEDPDAEHLKRRIFSQQYPENNQIPSPTPLPPIMTINGLIDFNQTQQK